MNNDRTEMNDKVKATISALLHNYMHGDITALRFEYVSPTGERIGLYTDDHMRRETDAVFGIEEIHPDLVEELKDTLAIFDPTQDVSIH